ncbi:hypothetical protein BY458DRAFT_495756 [Sporodiniella umbellata]|nr:hypothetical protein BY458DRAFT_495756 [Sporodiniella umbellata]
MGQLSSSPKCDHISAQTLHSTSAPATRRLSFFKRFSQRISIGRQRKRAMDPLMVPLAYRTTQAPAGTGTARRTSSSLSMIDSGYILQIPGESEGMQVFMIECEATENDSEPHNPQWMIYVINNQNVLEVFSGYSYEDLLSLSHFLGPTQPNIATLDEIEKALPTINWSCDMERELKNDQCLVCLDDFNWKQSVRVLNCHHVFHKDCVDRWLCEAHNSCPICRSVPV